MYGILKIVVNLKKTVSVTCWLALLACAWASPARAAERWGSWLPREFFTAELATTLDADGQTDWVRAYPCIGPGGSASFCVRVVVSETRSTQTIILKTKAKGVRITSRDVDGDRLPDVLVMSADDGSPLGAWINDGHGGFKESDVRSYPSSVWREDPLLCQSRFPERNSFASMSGIQDFCLTPFATRTPLKDTDRSFGHLEDVSFCSACPSNHSGRAPPAR